MKIVTRNISLAEDLARFAEREAEEGGYGSVSAYLAELVWQRRQAQVEADVALLKESMGEAPSGPEPIKEIVTASRDARQTMRQERWEPKG